MTIQLTDTTTGMEVSDAAGTEPKAREGITAGPAALDRRAAGSGAVHPGPSTDARPPAPA